MVLRGKKNSVPYSTRRDTREVSGFFYYLLLTTYYLPLTPHQSMARNRRTDILLVMTVGKAILPEVHQQFIAFFRPTRCEAGDFLPVFCTRFTDKYGI